jgi:LysM repeat protein
MFKRIVLLPVVFLLTFILSSASANPQRYTRSEYIDKWKDEAIRQMREHGIPASITLAQAILESGDGNSQLARDANNHFGIKCHGWNGKKVYHDDDRRQECFRKYKTAHQSFEDHSLFLKRSRYAFLFDYKITDYKRWSKGLKKAGYATNPRYPDLLIRLIEENGLAAYDQQGMNEDYRPGKHKSAPIAKSPEDGNNIVIEIDRGKKVYVSDNKIEYIITDANTTPGELSDRMNMGRWQIKKYNDLKNGDRIKPGTRIYIQPKRNKSRKHKKHVVATGETLYTISQKYGVKMKKIRKFSDLPDEYKATPGDTLDLQRTKKFLGIF